MILFHFHTETSRFFLLSVNTQTHTYLLQFKQVILSSVLVKRWRPWQVHWLFSLLFWIYSLLIHIFSDCFLPEKCVSTFHFDRRVFLLPLFLDPVYLTCQFSQSALFCAVYIYPIPAPLLAGDFYFLFSRNNKAVRNKHPQHFPFPPSLLQKKGIYTILYYKVPYLCFKMHPFFQNQCYPVELSIMMELFYICAVQYHNH